MPQPVEDAGAKDRGKDVDEDAGCVAGKLSNVPENALSHRVIRADIQHVDRAGRVKNYVKAGGGTAAG